MSGDDNFFDKFKLEVATGEVEVGKTYPIYGMITKIIDETFENFTVEVNFNLILRCFLNEENFDNKVQILKSRAFEQGIFVAEITGTNPIKGDCSTVIFGKQEKNLV